MTAGYQTWIADKLREYGCTVVEVVGWKTRGSKNFDPKGVVAHHTASKPRETDHVPSMRVVLMGRPEDNLPGPLCQVLIGRDGTCHVIAAGRANHAGTGSWRSLSGNSSVLGIEAENDGRGEEWTPVAYRAFVRASAALLDGIGQSAAWLCGHHEWTPRKIDPKGIEMKSMRQDVQSTIDLHHEPEETTMAKGPVPALSQLSTIMSSVEWLYTIHRQRPTSAEEQDQQDDEILTWARDVADRLFVTDDIEPTLAFIHYALGNEAAARALAGL